MTDQYKLIRSTITPRGNYAVNIRDTPSAAGLLLGKFSGLYEVDRSQDFIRSGSFTFHYMEPVRGVGAPGDDMKPGWVAWDFISELPAVIYDPGTTGESGITHFLTVLEAFLKMADLLALMIADFHGALIETRDAIEAEETHDQTTG